MSSAKENVGKPGAVASRSEAEKLARKLAGIAKRLDALAAAAPAVSKRWRVERAKEEKRLKKRRAELRKRTTKDLTGKVELLPPSLALPPPVEQPADTGPEPELAPPREGLIPGTFKVMDPDRLLPLLDAEPLPPCWTGRHVGRRLLDAFCTLRALPERDRPRGYGRAWPEYRPEAGDLALQAGAGRLAADRNRFRRAVSAMEAQLMEEALQWPAEHLPHVHAAERGWLIAWLDWPDADLDHPTAPMEFFEAIARALNAAGRVVR